MRIAVIAAVRTEPLREALRRGVAIERLLGGADRARYARAVTERRRVELVAGRIAARCAALASGSPHVSIAHTRQLALAAASDLPAGLDAEMTARRLPPAALAIAGSLHGWLVREAVGKLTRGGVLAPLDGALRPSAIAFGTWCDHSFCIAYAEEESDGS